MHFNIILSLTLLTTVVHALVIPAVSSSSLQARHPGSNIEDASDLTLREPLDIYEDLLDLLVREPKVTKARAARVATAKVAKAEKGKIFKAAAADHKKTEHLPDRKSTFHVAAGGGKPERTYTGKDVRKAVFHSHVKEHKLQEKQRTNPAGVTHADRHQKFENRPNDVPHHGEHSMPLPGMHVNKAGLPHEQPGREIELRKHGQPAGEKGPARAIIQANQKGGHDFKGVIAHDQSRLPKQKAQPANKALKIAAVPARPAHPGYNDHFHVPEQKHV